NGSSANNLAARLPLSPVPRPPPKSSATAASKETKPMMTEQQERLVSLLLGTFPNFQSGDAEAALTAYAMVITNADPRDVEPGIMMLINGELLGFDGRFAPTATQLARAIRAALDQRVDREIAERRAHAPPPDDWAEPSPEQRAKGKAILDQLAHDLGAQMRTEDAERDLRRKDHQERVNARFAPDMSEKAMAKRLGFATYNAADDDDYDMGQV